MLRYLLPTGANDVYHVSKRACYERKLCFLLRIDNRTALWIKKSSGPEDNWECGGDKDVSDLMVFIFVAIDNNTLYGSKIIFKVV